MTDTDTRHTFQPGELVNVEIRAARVMDPKPGHDHILTLGYTETVPGVYATIEINTSVAGSSITTTRVAPADWPPQLDDLWRDNDGKLWFVGRYEDSEGRKEIRFIPSRDSAYSYTRVYNGADLLRQHGPLTLVHREHRDQGDADL